MIVGRQGGMTAMVEEDSPVIETTQVRLLDHDGPAAAARVRCFFFFLLLSMVL